MGKITGFIEIERETPQVRPVVERIKDFHELYQPFSEERLRRQASRCMDCGVPFCHNGCSLNNLVPIWNDLVYRGHWEEAAKALHRTNNFPEVTGRICPALCEASCVVGLGGDAVTIREIEKSIAEEGFARGFIKPQPPRRKTDKRVAVIGSGPAGMAAAQQLVRAGHTVVLYEKNNRAGGILRYGIPDFKLEKWVIDRRLEQMKAEGLTIETGVHVGVDVTLAELRGKFDAICLTGGAEKPRDLSIEGRELAGIHFAMDFLTQQNRRLGGEKIKQGEISAKGKRVVVIGGGDTGADCVGTSVRQGAVRVVQVELLPKPPVGRSKDTPWPQWPHSLRTSTSHQEGCERMWSVLSKHFIGENGQVKGLHAVRLHWKEEEEGAGPQMKEVPDSAFTVDADLVLLAMGFLHPVHEGMLDELGIGRDKRGNVAVDGNQMTNQEGIFAAGDMATGQSLVLKAIASGRKAAYGIDRFLRGGSSVLETV